MKNCADEPTSKKKPRRSLLRLQDGGQPLPPQSGMATPSAGGGGVMSTLRNVFSAGTPARTSTVAAVR